MKLVNLVACLAVAFTPTLAKCEDQSFIRDGERTTAHGWFDERFGGDVSKLPFSFKLGDESSADVLKRAKADSETEELDAARIQRTITLTDEQTGLETKVVAVKYAEYPDVEWTVHFKNVGDADTPVLSDIQAVNVSQSIPTEASTILHHMKGSRAAPNDFEPYEMGLTMRTQATFRSAGGRGTNGSWPYFNINWGDQGLIIVVGWPGQWNLSLERDGAGGLAIAGGHEQTHF